MVHRFRVLLLVGLATLAADQATKYLAVSHLTGALEGRSGLARVEGFVSEQNLEDDPPVAGAARRTTPPYRFIGTTGTSGTWRTRAPPGAGSPPSPSPSAGPSSTW